MKIAYLTDTYQPEVNGIVTSITNFTTRLAEAGNEVLIIAPKYNRKKDQPIPNITIKRYASFSFATNKNTHIAYPALLGIIRDLREFKADIVHVQTPMSIGVSGVIAARILGIKLVQTYHTYLPDFMVYVNPYNLLGVGKASELVTSSRVWKKIIESNAVEKFATFGGDTLKRSEVVRAINKQLRRTQKYRDGKTVSDRFAWDFTRILYGRSDIVFSPSIALAKLLTRHRVGVPSIDMSNGIEFHQFAKKKDYHIRNKMIYVGRLGLEKGVDVVVKAFAIAREKNPALRLDIFGEGPAKKELEVLIAKLGIGESVGFVGFVTRPTIKRALKQHDFFVTASTMETQGLVILEAMAAGLPVLGVDALAVPELVHDEQNGYLVKPRDPKEMAEAMLKLTESAARNKKFGQKSLEFAEVHDISNCVTKLESAYKKLLS